MFLRQEKRFSPAVELFKSVMSELFYFFSLAVPVPVLM